MQWGVDPAHLARRIPAYQTLNPIQIGRQQLLPEDCVGLRARHVVQAVLSDLVHPRRDLGIVRRHDLRAAPR
jgi:hypothetical protein